MSFFSAAYLSAAALIIGLMIALSDSYQSELKFHFLPSQVCTRAQVAPRWSAHEVLIGRITPAFLRFYHAMYQALMFGMNLALLANNIGLMWVAIELATLTTVLMVGIYRTPEALEAACFVDAHGDGAAGDRAEPFALEVWELGVERIEPLLDGHAWSLGGVAV